MLDIDATVIVTFVLVWVLVWILTKVFFRPLRKVMDEREDKLQTDLGLAQAALDESARRLHEVEVGLRSSRQEAEDIRAECELEALKEKSKLVAEAGAAAKAEIESARAAFEAEVTRLKEELRAKAGPLAEKIERKLLSRS
ncbi:MAG: ATP synthase F0 subunit B [Candidatus Aminicenantes bacterium]|nr:ATP synthase F0 subunit B [Candidatus Aminicenantes bacterium]